MAIRTVSASKNARELPDHGASEPARSGLGFRANSGRQSGGANSERRVYIDLINISREVVAYAAQIAIDETAAGSQVTIVNPVAQRDHYVRGVRGKLIRAHDSKRRNERTRFLRALAARSGFSYIEPPRRSDVDYMARSRDLVGRLPDDFGGLLNYQGFQGVLGRSLASWLATDLARDSEPSIRSHKRRVVEELAQFLEIRDCFLGLIGHASGDAEVVVWNGRQPTVAAAWSAALDMGASVSFYVTTDNPGHFFHEDFAIHDRVPLQRYMVEGYEKADPRIRRRVAQDWFATRRSGKAPNQFQLWTVGGEIAESRRRNGPVVFFTSSPDELVGTVGDWSSGQWRDQFHAFREASAAVARSGYECWLRIHPNTATKSWREYLRTVTGYGGNFSRVILPTDDVDSYLLVARAQAIFVWSSTVGAESVACGTPTYVLGASTYDLFADVRKLPSLGAVDEIGANLRYEVDTDSALPFGYWRAVGARGRLSGAVASLWDAMEDFDRDAATYGALVNPLGVLHAHRAIASGPAPLIQMSQRLFGRRRTLKAVSSITRAYADRHASRRVESLLHG